jgi:hypothetical protein
MSSFSFQTFKTHVFQKFAFGPWSWEGAQAEVFGAGELAGSGFWNY